MTDLFGKPPTSIIPRGWPRLPPRPGTSKAKVLSGTQIPGQNAGMNHAESTASLETALVANQCEENEGLARRLEATGQYKILRRLMRRPLMAPEAEFDDKTGVIVDFETTGLDHTRDEIIEVAMVKFRYCSDGKITGVTGTFEAFNQPSAPIPADIVKLTGITEQMVAGHEIDGVALEGFVADANIVIAHNAGFDRKFAERSWDIFQHQPWACSATQIDWKKHGFGGAKLTYLVSESGFFYDAHRALDDCHATLEVLACRLPATPSTALVALLDNACKASFRIWAENAPFQLKNALKRRNYRWNDGVDGRPRSWYIDVDQSELESEKTYLRKEIYQRDCDIEHREITALERFSNRC